MKMLFKQENFSQDFKKTVGIVDADLSWDKIRPSLELATDDIIEIIGLDNYDLISGDIIPESFQRFSELVRFAIAFKSYILYAPTGDLAMTNKGRTMRRDDYEVGAFEWQIANHNESLERFFYRHMNLLLKFMVKNNLSINLEKFQHCNLIVPTLADFEKHFGLNDSYFLYLNLLPGLREFEELELLPRIGSELYENRDDLKLKTVLFNYSQKAAVYYSIDWGLRHLDIQMFPKSTFRTTEASGSDKSNRSTGILPAEFALIFEKDAKRYMKKMEAEMSSFRRTLPTEEFRLPDFDFNDDDNFVST